MIPNGNDMETSRFLYKQHLPAIFFFGIRGSLENSARSWLLWDTTNLKKSLWLFNIAMENG